MSQREEFGLRGPIKTCIEESTRAAFATPDGTQIPELKSSYTTEFSEEGRLISTRIGGSGASDWISLASYDLSGNILKTESRNVGGPITELVYIYDHQGKILEVTDRAKPDNPIAFHYDEHGRKTKVQVSRPEEYRPNGADARPPFASADSPPNLPGGGSAITFYDEQDRATEVYVRDAQGEVVSRAVRTYDKDGRVSEERLIWEHPEKMFPAQVHADMLKAGVSIEELRQKLMELMGGDPMASSIVYTYDAQGRVKETRQRIFNTEYTIDATYNEQGDKVIEITRCAAIGGQNRQAQRPGLPSYYEVRYSYEYDDHGNWTEETLSQRSSPDEGFKSSPGRRRQLTYY